MSTINTRRPDYQAYLLRLWRDGGQTRWRASLQSPAADQVHHFVNVEALFAFLLARLAAGDDATEATETQQPD